MLRSPKTGSLFSHLSLASSDPSAGCRAFDGEGAKTIKIKRGVLHQEHAGLLREVYAATLEIGMATMQPGIWMRTRVERETLRVVGESIKHF
jgi:hypothetical protein